MFGPCKAEIYDLPLAFFLSPRPRLWGSCIWLIFVQSLPMHLLLIHFIWGQEIPSGLGSYGIRDAGILAPLL